MNEIIKQESSSVPQNIYKPSEIIGIFNSVLARQSVNAQIVYLRGIYLANQKQGNWAYCYDSLRDEDSQEELTLRLTQQQRENLKNGNLVSVGGILNRNISSKGFIQIVLNVSRIEIVKEQAISEDEIKQSEEQCYILKLISTALSRGDAAESGNRSLDAMGPLIRTGTPLSETALSGTTLSGMPLPGTFCGQDGLAALPGGPESHDTAFLRTSLMQQASHALSSELLYMKFLQGIPIAGIIGGVYDAVYLKRIADYVDMKYKRRFLEKSNPDI